MTEMRYPFQHQILIWQNNDRKIHFDPEDSRNDIVVFLMGKWHKLKKKKVLWVVLQYKMSEEDLLKGICSCRWILYSLDQFSLVAHSCLTLCDPMDCSTPGFPVHHQVCSNSCPSSQWCHPTISSSVIPFFCLQSFPASRYFLMSWLSHQVANVLELQHQSFQWMLLKFTLPHSELSNSVL